MSPRLPICKLSRLIRKNTDLDLDRRKFENIQQNFSGKLVHKKNSDK